MEEELVVPVSKRPQERLSARRGIAGDIPLIHCIDELEEGKLVNVLRGWKRPAAGCYLYSTKHFVEYRRVKTFLDWIAEKHREILEQIDNRFGQLA